MKSIWKEELKPISPDRPSVFEVEMPKGAKVVLVGPDPEGNECVWFEFALKNGDHKVKRVLEIFGTGHLIPPLSTHVLSFKSGPFMWHLYDHGEITKPLGAH